jgi:hypothetical protein
MSAPRRGNVHERRGAIKQVREGVTRCYAR